MSDSIHESHSLCVYSDDQGDWPECTECYACGCCLPDKLANACEGFDERIFDA